MIAELRDVGDRAVRFPLPEGFDAAALRLASGVLDVGVTETHALVVFEDDVPDLEAALSARSAKDESRPALHSFDIVLDGEDRLAVVNAAALGSEDELARVLEDHELSVSFLGFCPGFAYLRGLHPSLTRIERRDAPRVSVPAGSLAIAGGFAGFYPFATPGGWNLLGRTGRALFDAERALLRAGDRVRLRVVSELLASGARGRAPLEPSARGVVVGATGPAFIQDLGRPHRLSEGIPIGGALVPERLVRANRLAGAADDAPAIERFGPIVLEARGDVRLATDDGVVATLAGSERASLAWGADRRVGYVAAAGGFDVPSLLGGHGTHVAAGLGGHEGRALRRGDVLSLGHRQAAPRLPDEASPPRRLVRVIPGPDAELCAEGALEAFANAEWRVAHKSDRTGIRLDGRPIPRRDDLPLRTVPMVAGAIELPPAGPPIVLGPDHPTTGGYQVLGVVASADLWLVSGAPVGSTLRFVLVSAKDLRAERRAHRIERHGG